MASHRTMNKRSHAILKLVKTFNEKGLDVDYKQLRDMICIEFGCSRRTATEYIELAKVAYDNQDKESVSP